MLHIVKVFCRYLQNAFWRASMEHSRAALVLNPRRFLVIIMKFTKCLLFLAVNAAPVARHFSPVAFAQPLPERRVLTGRVTDDAGNPLPRINITLQRENDLGAHAFWGTVAVTDAQGRYRIDNAEDGAYLISAEGDNFANVQNQHLVINANSTQWNAQLQRLTTLRLLLKNAEGAVLPKTRVALRLSKDTENNNSIAFARKTQRRAQTDAKGELEMPNIEPGTYTLDIALPGEGFAKIEDYAVKYEAQPIAREVQLQHGGDVKFIAREAGAEGENGRLLGGAILTLGEDLQISGEQRAQGAIVRQGAMDLSNLYAWSSDGSRAVTSDGSGELELQDLAPGNYTARLILPGYAPGEAQSFEIKAGENQTLTFQLKSRSKTKAVNFTLQSTNGAPVADRDWTLQLRFLQPLAPSVKTGTPLPDTLTIAPPAANLALPLEAAPPPPGQLDLGGGEGAFANFSGALTRRVHSDESSQFTLYPLPPGRWMLTMFATPQDDGDPRGPITQQTIDINADNTALITLKMQ